MLPALQFVHPYIPEVRVGGGDGILLYKIYGGGGVIVLIEMLKGMGVVTLIFHLTLKLPILCEKLFMSPYLVRTTLKGVGQTPLAVRNYNCNP